MPKQKQAASACRSGQVFVHNLLNPVDDCAPSALPVCSLAAGEGDGKNSIMMSPSRMVELQDVLQDDFEV